MASMRSAPTRAPVAFEPQARSRQCRADLEHRQPPPSSPDPAQPAKRRRAAAPRDRASLAWRTILRIHPNSLLFSKFTAMLQPLQGAMLKQLLQRSARESDAARPDTRDAGLGDPGRQLAGGTCALQPRTGPPSWAWAASPWCWPTSSPQADEGLTSTEANAQATGELDLAQPAHAKPCSGRPRPPGSIHRLGAAPLPTAQRTAQHRQARQLAKKPLPVSLRSASLTNRCFPPRPGASAASRR